MEYGERPGEPSYVAMELVEGDALNTVLEKQSRLPAKRALHIAHHMLAGLRHAHALGVIHRDVKLENVMLVLKDADPDFAKLLDLGIAKLVAPDDAKETRLTQKGELIGTPLYISPELLRGEEIDGRADLYSLTVVLYEMLASRPPFESRNTMGVFAMHLATPPPPLSEVAPEVFVPAVLEQLLQQGLAKDPASRIATAERYQERIEELLKLDWDKMPASQAAAQPRGRAVKLKAAPLLSTAGHDRNSAGPHHNGPLVSGLLFALRSRSTIATIVLSVTALIGLLYWVARDLIMGR